MWGECEKYVENISEQSVIECHQRRNTWLRQSLNTTHKQKQPSTHTYTHALTLPLTIPPRQCRRYPHIPYVLQR